MKRTLLLLFALLISIGGAWADAITISSTNGTFYTRHGTAEASSWNNYWVSTSSTPQIIMKTNHGGTNTSGNIFAPVSGKTKGDVTYTTDIRNGYGYSFFISTDYVITKITIQAWAQGGANKITDNTSGKQYSFTKDEAKIVEIPILAQEVVNAFNIQNNTAFYANVTVHYVKPTLQSTPFCIYGPTTGTFYKTDGTDGTKSDTYAAKWVSAQTNPQVTIESDANNLTTPGRTSTEGAACFFANGGKTYTISVPNSAKITGYALSGQSYTNGGAAGNNISATTTAGPTQTFTGSAEATLAVSGKDLRSTSFTLNGNNAFLRPSLFLIYAENDATFTANKASISNAKTYMVHGVRGDWQYAAADATSLSYTSTFNRTDDTRKIAFIKSATTGNYYAYSVKTGKFMRSDNSLSETPEPIYIFETGNADYPFFFSFTSDKSSGNINISGGVLKFSDFSTYDNGNRWCLYAAGDYEIPSAVSTAISDFETNNVTVTYKLTYNGSVIAEREVTQAVNSAAACPWAAPAYCSMGACSPATIVASTEEVNITMTSTLPFTISESYANATWYLLTLRGKYAYYQASTPYQLTAKATAVTKAENALWAFVGNPLDGFRVINKGAGEGKYLDSYSNTYPTMGTSADSYSLWTIGQNDSGFTLHVGTQKYIHDAEEKSIIGYWDSASAASNPGSALTVEDVDYYDLSMAYIDQYATANAITDDGYFGVRPTDASAYKGLISTAFSSNHAGVTSSMYENTIKPGCEGLIRQSYPTTGYYRLKNANETGKYLGYDGTADAGNSVCLRGMEDNTSAKTILHWVKGGTDAVPTYQIGVEGTYMAAVSKSAKSTPSATPADFKVEYVAPGYASFSTTLSGFTYLHCAATQEYAIVGWSTGKDASASKWQIEKVTSLELTLNDGGDGNYYATMCLPFDVTVSNTTAYTTTLNDAGTYLTLTECEGGIVPAGTPVVLKGTNSTATAAIAANAATNDPITTTALTGTYVNVGVDTGGYVSSKKVLTLGKDEGGNVGFFWFTKGTSIGANKAYMLVDATSSVRGFAFDFGGTNAINNVTSSKSDAAVFDLQGRRVNNATRGIYIQNGKKVLK